MAVIPVGEVAFAGFDVVRRKPLAVLVWGLVMFAFFLAILVSVTAMFGSLWQAVEQADGAEPSLGDVLAMQTFE